MHLFSFILLTCTQQGLYSKQDATCAWCRIHSISTWFLHPSVSCPIPPPIYPLECLPFCSPLPLRWPPARAHYGNRTIPMRQHDAPLDQLGLNERPNERLNVLRLEWNRVYVGLTRGHVLIRLSVCPVNSAQTDLPHRSTDHRNAGNCAYLPLWGKAMGMLGD